MVFRARVRLRTRARVRARVRVRGGVRVRANACMFPDYGCCDFFSFVAWLSR